MNISYIHMQLYVLIVDCWLWIKPCGSRCLLISTIHHIDHPHMNRQDQRFCDLVGSFPVD